MADCDCATPPGRKGQLQTALLAAAFLASVQSLTSASPAKAAEICWNQQALQNVEGNQLIRRDVQSAYVPLPRGDLAPIPAGFRPIKGAVRRVNLPQGAPKLVALTFDLCEQPYEVSGY